jgi:tetratricopeptide (TPR) repeat protein
LAAPTFVAALLAIGEEKRAQRYAQRAYDRAGGRLRVMVSALALGEALRHAGPERWAQAERCYAQAIELAETLDSRVNLAAARLGAAELAIAQGNRSAGNRHLGHALRICRDLGLGRYKARVEELLAVTEGNPDSEAGVGQGV